MKKIQTIILVSFLILLTGCGSAIKDKNKKMVVYKPTG